MKRILIITTLSTLAVAEAQTTKPCVKFPFDNQRSIGAGIVDKRLVPSNVKYEDCPIENITMDSLANQAFAKKILKSLGKFDQDTELFDLMCYKFQYNDSYNIEILIFNFFSYYQGDPRDYGLVLFLLNPHRFLTMMTKDDTGRYFDNLKYSMDFFYMQNSEELVKVLFKERKSIKPIFIVDAEISSYFTIHPSFYKYMDKKKKYINLGAYVDDEIKKKNKYTPEEIEMLKKIQQEVCKPF